MTVQAPDGYKFLLVNEDGKDGAGERSWVYSHERLPTIRKMKKDENVFFNRPFHSFFNF